MGANSHYPGSCPHARSAPNVDARASGNAKVNDGASSPSIAGLARRAIPPETSSREQNRRKFLAAFDRRGIGRTPGGEKLQKLLACAVVLPFAVALHDRQQMLDRLRALALGVQRGGEVETGLMIERIGGDLLLQRVDGSDGFRLL